MFIYFVIAVGAGCHDMLKGDILFDWIMAQFNFCVLILYSNFSRVRSIVLNNNDDGHHCKHPCYGEPWAECLQDM